ncbi:flagellar biosynthesis protein FlhB [Wenzhouxiangella sp. AB-CW3]|uniref:flagellar biosynthesis protein FlhB n=1 Tax=Wenzhouxiangella sp. AB-CW3 TaxID=2771012 RepID=UPI00168B2CC2|nr:flagellar biosynthesis protein FlhB [Wenzhouxiangella sp. AB-CW3]QOC21192.1 flagellar biosynthesis protein FlhB [Wenzhouxiangella sp. AB-CW3]
MAENDNSQEKTEQPTPKRLKDAREKGQVPRSRELTMTLVMLVGATTLYLTGGRYAERLSGVLERGFSVERGRLYDDQFILEYLAAQIADGLLTVAPKLLILVIVALMAPALIGGWNFSQKALVPKPERLNPIKGLKRVFGPRGLMELFKAMGKFLLVGSAAILVVYLSSDRFLTLGSMPTLPAMATAVGIAGFALISLSATLILIAAIDVPFQLHTHNKQLRMTRKEVRDEQKETEGQPEVKSKQRSLQQEISSRRMAEAVPKADVVVTNPTHFAVALKYDSDNMAAPVVVAKGADHMAAAIRRIAQEAGVPLLEAPPLARALFRSAEIGQSIPAELYVAVAEVMAWVYQIRNPARRGERLKPPNPDVDEANED